jgi:hypothetical protein
MDRHASDSYDLRKMRTFPVPTAYFRALAFRTPTEIKVALAVARCTLGWQVKGKPMMRRASAILTHRDLQKFGGCRSSVAISKALDSLVRDGLLETLAADGTALVTSAERRRYHGSLRLRIPRQHVEEKTGRTFEPAFVKKDGLWRISPMSQNRGE